MKREKRCRLREVLLSEGVNLPMTFSESGASDVKAPNL